MSPDLVDLGPALPDDAANEVVGEDYLGGGGGRHGGTQLLTTNTGGGSHAVGPRSHYQLINTQTFYNRT